MQKVMDDKILQLPLPDHLNHLIKLFEQFETNFRLHRSRHDQWTMSLEIMQQMIETSFARSFRESHFQQFLTVAQGFFIHKWEMRKGKLQLFIEMPHDIID